MEIIQPVADAFVSAVAIGSLIFAAMLFTVQLSQIIADSIGGFDS